MILGASLETVCGDRSDRVEGSGPGSLKLRGVKALGVLGLRAFGGL